MSTQPETRLQRRIQKALRKTFPESWWYKVWGGPFTPAGIPDLVGCVEGLFFALEVKLPIARSKTSVIQDETIADIQRAGGASCVVRSPAEAVSFVQRTLIEAGRGKVAVVGRTDTRL